MCDCGILVQGTQDQTIKFAIQSSSFHKMKVNDWNALMNYKHDEQFEI